MASKSGYDAHGPLLHLAGIQIALVREDSTTALCEDSCSFAEDGQCDEPGVVSDVASIFTSILLNMCLESFDFTQLTLIFIFSVQLTTSRIGNLTRLIHTVLYV